MPATSEAKLAANRANALLSTGPPTAEGKAKVSLNAVKTGLTGRTVLLPSDDVAAYQATIARFSEHWQPETDEERVLVQSLADNDWRTQRIPELEYGIYAQGACEFADGFAAEPDPAIRRTRIQTKTFLTYSRQLLNLQTQDARLRRQREKDEARLRQFQRDRKYEAAKAAQHQQPQPVAPAIKEQVNEHVKEQPKEEAKLNQQPPPKPQPTTRVNPILDGLDFSKPLAGLTMLEFSRKMRQIEDAINLLADAREKEMTRFER